MTTVRKSVSVFVFVLLLAFISATASAGEFTVVRVYDGDTVLAKGHDVEIKIRLAGIDAPETGKKKNDPGQPFSQRSRKYLAQLVLNKPVNVIGYGRGPYGRTIGELYLDGKNINLAMVYFGLAEVYRGKMSKGFDAAPYWQAEEIAKSAKSGMWTLGDQYESPKAFRKRKKGK